MYKKIVKDLNNNQSKYTIIIIVAVIVIISFLTLLKNKPDDTKDERNSWRIQAITAKKTQANPELQLYGTIINPFTSRLKSTIETYVNTVNIREGQFVNKNDTLVELDKSEISLDVKAKEATVNEIKAKLLLEKEKNIFDKKSLVAEKKQLELTEQNLQRQQSLRKKRLNAQLNLDDAAIELQKMKIVFYNRELEVKSYQHKISEIKAQLLQAQTDYNKAKLDLERTSVKAPFNGYISKLFVSPGTRIQPNETMLEIFDQDANEIKIQVPQVTMSLIQKSIKSASDIYATTTIYNKKYSLKFRNLTANQDVTTGGTDAFFTFQDKNKTKEIRTIGKTVTVTLILPKLDNIYIIPTLSLHHNDRVYLIKNNKLKAVDVNIQGTIKRDSNEFIIIKSKNIKDGDKILASVLPSAIDGLAVEIIKNQP